MGDRQNDAVRVDIDRQIKLDFHGSTVTCNAGLLADGELDDGPSRPCGRNRPVEWLSQQAKLPQAPLCPGRLRQPLRAAGRRFSVLFRAFAPAFSIPPRSSL
jgi:hypothetical protein